MIVYGLAPTGRIFLLGIAMTALYGLVTPSLQSLMTRAGGAVRTRPAAGRQRQPERHRQHDRAACCSRSCLRWRSGPFRDRHVPGAPFLLAAVLLLLRAGGGMAGDDVDTGNGTP